MDIIVALHCLNLALDHTWENVMLSKVKFVKVSYYTSLHPYGG
jgi:hypothetical protein